MRTKLLAALTLLGASFTMACMPASAPRRQLDEWHRVVQIPKIDSDTISSSGKAQSGERGERVVIEQGGEKVTTHTGTWLARYRWEPYNTVNDESRRRLATIEILFCPFDKNDFTRCRVGVAWSRSVHPLGEQLFRAVSN